MPPTPPRSPRCARCHRAVGPTNLLPALNRIAVDFVAGSAVVPQEAGEVLKAAAAAIAALPEGTRIVITVHTDDIGAPGANRELSLRRAAALRLALIEHGAPAGALLTDGAGDSRPVADNRSEAGRYRNRRTEFSLAP